MLMIFFSVISFVYLILLLANLLATLVKTYYAICVAPPLTQIGIGSSSMGIGVKFVICLKGQLIWLFRCANIDKNVRTTKPTFEKHNTIHIGQLQKCPILHCTSYRSFKVDIVYDFATQVTASPFIHLTLI